MREDQLRGEERGKNDAPSIKYKLLVTVKGDAGVLQCPVADSCCLLLHINLGKQHTVPHGALKCSAQKKKVSFDACQTKTAAACRQFPQAWLGNRT